MQPFDDISSPELGLEDDVLLTPTSPTSQWQPKWMRSPHTSSSTTTVSSSIVAFLSRFYDAALRALSSLQTFLLTTATTHVPPLLRPRLTVRYVLFSALVVYVSYRLLTARPLLASNLPSYSGPYDVGAVDVELPIPSGPQRVSNITFKSTSQPAFEVQTVLFTLYYPTLKARQYSKTETQQKLYWIPKPISGTATGYLRFLGADNFLLRPIVTFALWCIAGGITIPVRVGAPLLPADATETKSQLPVMVFTHGMLSSRTDYTNYLGELASRGMVVAALEHRDGSSPGSAVRQFAKDGKHIDETWRYCFGLKDLNTDDDGKGFDTAALKEAQLSFREAEIHAAVTILQNLNKGSPEQFQQNPRHPPNFNPSAFQDRLDTSNFTLAGHSYGATGVLRALRPDVSNSPFTGAVALDPGKSSGPLNADIHVPLAIVHSASWSKPGPTLFYGRPHFEVVRGIVEDLNNATETSPQCTKRSQQAECPLGWFLTSLGTSHPSVTDAPLLEPLLLAWTTGATMDAADGIRQYVLLTRDFVGYQHGGAREGVLALSGRKDEGFVRRDYDPKHNTGMPAAWRKYWQIHVAPE